MVDIGFSQEMKMQHSLAPQLYQSLEILQMPIMDLQNLIKQELSENPTLEIINKNEDVNLEVESGTSDQDQFDMEISSYESDNYDYASPSELTEKYQYILQQMNSIICPSLLFLYIVIYKLFSSLNFLC